MCVRNPGELYPPSRVISSVEMLYDKQEYLDTDDKESYEAEFLPLLKYKGK